MNAPVCGHCRTPWSAVQCECRALADLVMRAPEVAGIASSNLERFAAGMRLWAAPGEAHPLTPQQIADLATGRTLQGTA